MPPVLDVEPFSMEDFHELIQLTIHEFGREPEELAVGNRDWIDIRKHGSGHAMVFDLNTDPESLKKGHVATLFGVRLRLDRDLDHRVAKGADGRTMAHSWPGENPHSGDYGSCGDPDCVIRFVMTE